MSLIEAIKKHFKWKDKLQVEPVRNYYHIHYPKGYFSNRFEEIFRRAEEKEKARKANAAAQRAAIRKANRYTELNTQNAYRGTHAPHCALDPQYQHRQMKNPNLQRGHPARNLLNH